MFFGQFLTFVGRGNVHNVDTFGKNEFGGSFGHNSYSFRVDLSAPGFHLEFLVEWELSLCRVLNVSLLDALTDVELVVAQKLDHSYLDGVSSRLISRVLLLGVVGLDLHISIADDTVLNEHSCFFLRQSINIYPLNMFIHIITLFL